jgi:hypothetical protein
MTRLRIVNNIEGVAIVNEVHTIILNSIYKDENES